MKTIKLFLLLISLVFALSNTTKADTISLQLPLGPQSYCQSTGFDTFVIHKPVGFGSTMWYVNFSLFGIGDSIVYIPTTAGTFDIAATWNSLNVGTTLNLYVIPPAHALFSVLSGGSINATNDTIWMCDPSVSVASNTIGSEAISYAWHGPGVNNSTNDPIILTTPGTYYFERPNSCDVTRDTFELVQLPSTLPSFGTTNITFCNIPVDTLLDPGPGWTYLWTPGGATTQTLQVNTADTYTVNLNNQCLSGAVSVTVEHQSFPGPYLAYLQGSPMCMDSILVLDPDTTLAGHIYDTYDWTPGGATTPTITISGLTTGSGVYQVTVTQGSCTATAYGSFDFYQEPVRPEECIVTVNHATNKNEVVWTHDYEPFPGDMNYSPTASYNIYKWAGGNVWTLLGNVPVDQEHTFIDMTSNPPVVSARYKISMIDACGVESIKSFLHQTVHLSSSLGSTIGDINLAWDPYIDSSGVFVIGTYEIWKGTHPDSLTYYDQTPMTSYTDNGVVGQVYYQIVVIRSGGCDPTPALVKGGGKTLITGSFSNVTDILATGISTYNSDIPMSIYPNPSTGIFHIEGQEISRVEIMDGTGRLITSFDNQPVIDLSAFASGIYHARISDTQGSTNQYKLVIVK